MKLYKTVSSRLNTNPIIDYISSKQVILQVDQELERLAIVSNKLRFINITAANSN